MDFSPSKEKNIDHHHQLDEQQCFNLFNISILHEATLMKPLLFIILFGILMRKMQRHVGDFCFP